MIDSFQSYSNSLLFSIDVISLRISVRVFLIFGLVSSAGFDQYLVTCVFLAFKQPSQPHSPWAQAPVTLLYEFYLVKIINPVYMQ
jgi:hypothetical protein